MIDLIERIEAASGPDRELDADICATLRVGTEHEWARKNYPIWIAGRDGTVHLEKNGPSFAAPPFTASLDAAMMLVPGYWGISIEQERPTRACEASLSPPGGEPWDAQAVNGEGLTLALAICSAALRACMAGL